MDVELGLKLTRPADGFSSANFQFLKDHRNPLFQSRETITMFILTAHLRGYKRGDIKIEINEDGSVMVIGGEKAVEETVMMGWKLYKKGTETLKLKKSFRIPNGVVLDKIEAMFNEDESVLTVSMPKTVTGMVGSVVEEIMEEIPRQKSEEIPQSPRKPERKLQGSEEEHGQDSWEDDKLINLDEDSTEDDQETSLQNPMEETGESSGAKQEEVADEEELPRSDEGDVHQEDEDHRRREEEEEEEGGEKCSSILCAPIVAGSALLLSFVVFAIQCIRRTNRPTPQNNVE